MGYDKLFAETFGDQFQPVSSCRYERNEALLNYLAIAPVNLIYKYNTSSDERKLLLFDFDLSAIMPSLTIDKLTDKLTGAHQIMKTLGADEGPMGS